jgi:hypothetical protein
MWGIGASGGYGNDTCVQHTATMWTCYAHPASGRLRPSIPLRDDHGRAREQGPGHRYVGNTGHSFGADLQPEVRINGARVQPLSYL